MGGRGVREGCGDVGISGTLPGAGGLRENYGQGLIGSWILDDPPMGEGVD